jgi:hypothetical protein
MRILILVAALTFATSASAARETFKFDEQGSCRDAHGHFVSPVHCKAPPKKCKDPKSGRLVKCPH